MNTQIYLVLSQDIQDFFQENSINLQDIFLKENIEATIEYSSDPSLDNEIERDKAIIPKVITSSVAAILIIGSLTSLLEQVYRQPYVVEFYENQELRDSKGEIIFDTHGDPRMKLVKKIELIQPKQDQVEKEVNINLDITKGILIKIKELRK
jgi:hypothetical protein